MVAITSETRNIMAPTLRQTTSRAAVTNVIDEDSMDVDEPQVRLKTSDGKRFTLTKSEASCSNALRAMIESFQNAPNNSTEYINLQSVNSCMLTKVIEWCQVHCNDDYNNGSENTGATCTRESEGQLTDWDKSFFKSMPEDELFEMMHVANYLDVRGLFNGCCQTVAKCWEGKKVEEIRRMYNIENDFMPEEENQMIQENKKLGMDN